MKQIIVISLLFLTFTASSSLAQPVAAKLSDLIANSELIVIAKPRKLATEKHDGNAILRIERVVKGEIKDDQLEVRWSLDERDQPIEFLRVRTLLFLKKDAGPSYYATIPGRSFWSLLTVEEAGTPANCRALTPFAYPIDGVETRISRKAALVYLPFLPARSNPARLEGYCLEDVLAQIAPQENVPAK